jgi:hypothetical protein
VGDTKEIYIDPNDPSYYRDKKFKPNTSSIGTVLGVIFAFLIGAGMTIAGIYGDELDQFRMTKEMAAATVAILIVLPGIIMTFYGYKRQAERKKNCTTLITATCIRVEFAPEDSSKRPVYGISFNGQNYELARDYYTKPMGIKEGEIRNIYINPQKPLEFYDPRDKTSSFMLIFGALFALSGALAAVIMLFA